MADHKKRNSRNGDRWPPEPESTDNSKDLVRGSKNEDRQFRRSFTKISNEDDNFEVRRNSEADSPADQDQSRGRCKVDNRDWEEEPSDNCKNWDKTHNMERGRFPRDREGQRGRGRWNAERTSPGSPSRGRFQRGDRSNWGNHGGRDRRFRSPPGRRSRSHSPQRKRVRSRSASRSRSRSPSDSPRDRRNFSRSTSRNRGRNVSVSRSKSPPNRQQHMSTGYMPQDPFRGPQPPGVDSPVVRPQYAAPFQNTSIPPPAVPPPQGHPPGPPPGYPGYDSYYQHHQPPPSLYPPGVPEYVAPQASAPVSMSWSAPDYTHHMSDMKHNNASAVPTPVPVPVPVPQPSHDISVPPPPGTAEDSNKKEAIERELRTQKQNLVTQRDEYIRKSKVFERELGLLRGQEEELSAENSRDNERILQENHKLQVEIQNKLKAINNVIDMLTGIIGDNKELAQKMVEIEAEKTNKKKVEDIRSHSRSSGKGRSRSASSSDSSVEDVTARNEKPENTTPEEDFQKYNYIHFDPENHWCRVCNTFPRTAKEYLHHLHSAEHKDLITARKLVDMPWHKDHPAEEVPQVPGAPTKRTPIKGLQFFISAPAWYCKLCAVWMGDLHCASIHLKSKLHAIKYHSFIKENEGWESNWLAEREQAYERLGDVKDEKKLEGHLPAKKEKPDLAESSGKERQSRAERHEKSEYKMKKRGRSSSESSSGSADRNQDIEATGGWVKERVRVENDKERARMRDKERAREKDPARNRGREREGHEVESETDKSKSIRVAMRNKESRLEKSDSMDQPMSAPTVQLKSKWDSPDRKNGASPTRSGNRHGNAPDDRMMREWLPVEESESQLLTNLKDRVKRKNEDNHKDRGAERDPKEKDKDKDKDKDKPHKDRKFFPEPQYGRNKFTRDLTPPRNRRSRGGNEETRWESSATPGTMRESPPPHRRMSDGKGRDRGERDGERDRHRERDRGDRDGDRDRHRERDREQHRERDRDRGRERDRDRERDEDGRRHPPERREEDEETSFEKQSGGSRGKQQPVMTIKSKLPFIGRMPVFKNFSKKGNESKDDGSPPHTSPGANESTPPTAASSALDGSALKDRIQAPSAAQINASIMEYKARLLDGTAKTVESPTSTVATVTGVSSMPKSTLILSKTPSVSIDNLMKNNKDSDMKMQLKKLSEQIQFMEKVQSAPVATSDDAVPMELEEEAESGPGLAKDFQDALDIIFPDPSKPPPEPKSDADVSNLPDVKNPPPNILATMPNLSNPPPSMLAGAAPVVPPMMGSMPPPPMGVPMDGSVQNGAPAPMAAMGMGMDGSLQPPGMGLAMYDGPPGTYPDMSTQPMYPPGMGPMGPMGPMGGPRMGCPPMGGPMGPPPMGMPMGPPPMGMGMGPPPMGMPMGPRPPTTPVKSSKLDLSADDMAMLGIDADDIGAQGM